QPPLLLLGAHNPGGGGFMAESFVRPPVDLDIVLPHQTSLASLILDPRIRRGCIRAATVFTMGINRDRWEFAGKLQWENSDPQPHGLHNTDVSPPMLLQAVGARSQAPANTRWTVIHGTPSSASLHYVKQIRVQITGMHEVHAIGLGRIEIWAQPSQRLPADQRTHAWSQNIKAIQSSSPLHPPHTEPIPPSNTNVPPVADCPQEYLDPITHNIMTDPVVLPTGTRCDRSTIVRHLQSHRTDPFTGLPLDLSQIQPDLSLRLRIHA
ncbi:RING finger protein 37, partial [Coemansia sp. RSA 1933]